MAVFSSNVKTAFSERRRFTEFNERIMRVVSGRGSEAFKENVAKLIGDNDDVSASEFPGSENIDDLVKQVAYGFVLLILEMIYERTLADQIGCTLADIRSFFENEVLKVFHAETCRNLTNDDISNMVTYIIRDTLQNSGRPYYHYVPDIETGKYVQETFKIIEETRQIVDGEEGIYYRATQETINYYLHTYEIGRKFNFDLEAMIIEESFKRKNYHDAERSLRTYLTRVRAQAAVFDELRRRIVRDVIAVDASELNEEADKFIELVDDACRGNEKVQNSWKVFESEEITASSEEEFLEIKKTTSRIKRLIHDIGVAIQTLYDTKASLQKTRREAIENRNVRFIDGLPLSFEECVLDIIPKATDITALVDIFIKLCSLKPMRFPTPQIAYAKQSINGTSEIFEVERFDDVLLEDEDEGIDDDAIMEEFMDFMVRRYAPGEMIPFSEIVRRMEEEDEESLVAKISFYICSATVFQDDYYSKEYGVSLRISDVSGNRVKYLAAEDEMIIEMSEMFFMLIPDGKEKSYV